MANETNETPNFRLPEPFHPGSRLTARNMQDLRGAIAFCLGDMIVDGPGILISKTAGGQYIFEARRAGRRGVRGVSSSLRLEEDPDFDAEAPTVVLRGGNFSGKNVDTEVIEVDDDDVQYVFGYLKFNYAGKAESETLAIVTGVEDPDDPDRQNDFPEYADGDQFTGEAWYYIGKFWREEIPDTTPQQYEVKKANAHPGGNVLWEYGCDGNIRWGVKP